MTFWFLFSRINECFCFGQTNVCGLMTYTSPTVWSKEDQGPLCAGASVAGTSRLQYSACNQDSLLSYVLAWCPVHRQGCQRVTHLNTLLPFFLTLVADSLLLGSFGSTLLLQLRDQTNHWANLKELVLEQKSFECQRNDPLENNGNSLNNHCMKCYVVVAIVWMLTTMLAQSATLLLWGASTSINWGTCVLKSHILTPNCKNIPICCCIIFHTQAL